MNRIRHIRRLTAALAGLACAWLGIALAAPAAFAAAGRFQPPGGESGVTAVLPAPLAAHIHQPAPGTPAQISVHTAAAVGMPGWQIALIAIGAEPSTPLPATPATTGPTSSACSASAAGAGPRLG
jgi:hypothetical protein